MNRINIFIDGKEFMVTLHAQLFKARYSRKLREVGIKPSFDKIEVEETPFGAIHTYRISRQILTHATD